MNIAFTIVAGNYLALACTLADSLKRNSEQTDLLIYVIDATDGVPDELLKKYRVETITTAIVPELRQMAFKYSVTEFSTAVKPFIFKDLFEVKGYEKVMYCDPDLCFYTSPGILYTALDEHNCLLTPHLTTAEVHYSGNVPETEFLFAGIYNLGFIALKRSEQTKLLLNWWAARLEALCYGDRLESLHVDQKWIDFIPALFPDDVKAMHHPGLNIAYWNIHERMIERDGDVFTVQSNAQPGKAYPLVFLHFSGVNPLNIYKNKQYRSLDIKKYPVWEKLIQEYASAVLANGHANLVKLSYAFAAFDNGETITPLHRRLYRRLLDMNRAATYTDPFSTAGNGFYELLAKNRLLTGGISGSIDASELPEGGAVNKLKKMLWLMRLAKKTIGIRKYSTLVRFFQKMATPENQVFLLKGFEDDFVKDYAEKYFNK